MKLQTVGSKKNLSVANILETVINDLTKDLKIDKRAVEDTIKTKVTEEEKNKKYKLCNNKYYIRSNKLYYIK